MAPLFKTDPKRVPSLDTPLFRSLGFLDFGEPLRLLPLLLSLRFVPGLRGFVGFSGYFEVQGAFQRAPWFFW